MLIFYFIVIIHMYLGVHTDNFILCSPQRSHHKTLKTNIKIAGNLTTNLIMDSLLILPTALDSTLSKNNVCL